ncbi:Saccharopine dehydrogenase-domain-containing protein [Trichophaea hybrida]|nr:Saccharopine dehydrogenase-domain-containing protein [Trichophaea hybrida]
MAREDIRTFDLVVLGATGYTGKLTCEQVLRGTPSNLRWAIAGRSLPKLQLLASEYNKIYTDRIPVYIYETDLSESSLEKLAVSTRLLISTVGPYIKYGSPVLEACAVYGTHYVDCTGEFPWVYDMIKKYHQTAKNKQAIMIPQCGFESAPLDLGTFALVKAIRDELAMGVGDVKFSVHELKGAVSGGTLETSLCLFEHATLHDICKAAKFDALSPVKGPKQPFRYPICRDVDLGILTSWIGSTGDRSIVYRSWGLIEGGKFYGENFSWKEYRRVSNYVSAFSLLIIMNIAIIIPLLSPLRWLVRKILHPGKGEGPSNEFGCQLLKGLSLFTNISRSRRNHRVEWRGVATVDDDSDTPRKAFVRVQSTVDPYNLTALCIVQVANSILFNKTTLAAKLGGGILTPATVASTELFELLEQGGLMIETKII